MTEQFTKLVPVPRWVAIHFKWFTPRPNDEHTGPIMVPAWKVRGTIFDPDRNAGNAARPTGEGGG